MAFIPWMASIQWLKGCLGLYKPPMKALYVGGPMYNGSIESLYKQAVETGHCPLVNQRTMGLGLKGGFLPNLW